MATKTYLDTAGLRALWGIINTRDTATQTKIATLIGNVSGDNEKSVREISAEEVAKIVAGADENYDTLKEIADWIKDDTTDAARMVSDINSLKTTVGDSTSGLVKDVDDLQGTVGDSTSGLVKDVNDLKTAVGDSNSGLVKQVADLEAASEDYLTEEDLGNDGTGQGATRSGIKGDIEDLKDDVNALETTVGDSNSGLVKDIADINTEIGGDANYNGATGVNPTAPGSGIKGRISVLEHGLGQVTDAVLPIANTLTVVKGALGTQDDLNSATYTGANAQNTKTAFARIKALEEINASADTIEAIPTAASDPATGDSVAEICVFTYGQS